MTQSPFQYHNLLHCLASTARAGKWRSHSQVVGVHIDLSLLFDSLDIFCAVVQESFDNHIQNVTCVYPNNGWQLPYYSGLQTMREGLLRVEVCMWWLLLLRQQQWPPSRRVSDIHRIKVRVFQSLRAATPFFQPVWVGVVEALYNKPPRCRPIRKRTDALGKHRPTLIFANVLSCHNRMKCTWFFQQKKET
jgi:hypothetical protein